MSGSPPREDEVAALNRAAVQAVFRANPPILLVMGVSGAGKTSVGKALAQRLGWAFEEGDLLHPEANITKMRSGIPLTDADRAPWLAAVAAWIDERRRVGEPGVITCSALKRAYRRVVIGDRPEVRLVYLRGARDLIADRLARRSDHFMPPGLLESQFDTLEEPGPEENPLIVDIGPPVAQIAEAIIHQLASAQQQSGPIGAAPS